MTWFYVLVGVVIVLVALGAAKRLSTPPEPESHFKQRDALFSAAERSFLGVLDQATAGRYRVFGKIRVADILTPAQSEDRSSYLSLFNQIKAKHFDFVLCDPGTLDVKAVIELNDKSHKTHVRAERDKLLRAACQDARLPYIEVPARRGYSLDDVKQLLSQMETQLQGDPVTEVKVRIEPKFE